MKDQFPKNLDNATKEALELLISSIASKELDKVFYSLNSPDKGYVYHWFFNISTKSLERFCDGIHVEILEDYDEDSYLCFYKTKTIIIKKSKIGIRIEH